MLKKPPPAIEVCDLVWRPAGASAPTLDLRGTRISLAPGGLLLITGASGAGKSTLLLALAGLLGTLLPGELSGELTVGGIDLVAAATRGEPGPPVAHLARLGLIPAGPAPTTALPRLLDDAALPLESRIIATGAMRQAIDAAAHELTISPLLERSAAHLSGGERMLAAALAALVAQPQLLIADEPFNSLDAATATTLRQAMRATGATRVISTHTVESLGETPTEALHLVNGRGATALAAGDPTITAQLASAVHLYQQTSIAQLRGARAPGREMEAASIDVIPGTATILTGATGSGKSTLLSLVAGTLPLSVGARTVADVRIAYAPQDPGLLLGARPARQLIAVENLPRALALAERLRVARLVDAMPARLSDGERRRLALVVALARDAELVLLDEPTAGLDAAAAAQVSAIIDELAVAGAALLIATHDATLTPARARHINHPRDTITAGGASSIRTRLTAPLGEAVDAAQQLLSPVITRRLIGSVNPLTRVGLALFWFLLSLISPATLLAQGAIAIPALLIAWRAGVDALGTLRIGLALTPAALGLFLANVTGGAEVEQAVGAVARLLTFAAGSLVLLRPFEPLRLADAAVERLGAPFAPTMALLTTAATIPAMFSEARERRAIRRLTTSRGGLTLLVDLFDSFVRAVPRIAIALEIRGVRMPTRMRPATRFRPSTFGRADLVLIIVSAGGVLVSIARALLEPILAR
jgi:energy-coupling factor transport system ATP-binding protein